MRNKRLLISLLTCMVAGSVLLQCIRCTPISKTELNRHITLVSYNAQTFFDAVEDGSEFKEFKGSKSQWTERKYRIRLERLKQTMFAAGKKLTGKENRLPDIAVLQEIENSRVVEDFCKQLSNRENYPYAVCPSRSGKDAFTTVLLSKYPIENFFVHYIYADGKTALRPLVEAVINTGSKDKPLLLTVFAVHWKSKSGQSDSTAIRNLQEAQLIKKIREHKLKNPEIPFIVCGDFNQPLEEFGQMGDFTVCWNLSSYKAETDEGTQPAGSYYFKGAWEKIDHIFYDAGMKTACIEPTAFFVLYEPPLIDGDKPVRYNVFTGEGYSDHLPLGFCFKIQASSRN